MKYSQLFSFVTLAILLIWMTGVVTVQDAMAQEEDGTMKEYMAEDLVDVKNLTDFCDKNYCLPPSEITIEIRNSMLEVINMHNYITVEGIPEENFASPSDKQNMLNSIKSADKYIQQNAISSAIMVLDAEVLSKVDGGSDDTMKDNQYKKAVRDIVEGFRKSLSDSSIPAKLMTKPAYECPKDYLLLPTGACYLLPSAELIEKIPWWIIVIVVIFVVAAGVLAGTTGYYRNKFKKLSPGTSPIQTP